MPRFASQTLWVAAGRPQLEAFAEPAASRKIARTHGSLVNPVTDEARPRILWIDDEPAFVRYAFTLLTGHGFKVRTAVDGRSGLALARRRSFDVIILDLRLPDMSGVDVLRTLRTEGIDEPVLVLSGYGTFELGAELTGLGATACRSKPIRATDLISVINDLLPPREAVAQPRNITPERTAPTGMSPGPLLVTLPAVAELLTLLQPLRTYEGSTASYRSKFVAIVMRLLAEPGIDIQLWCACGRTLKGFVDEHEPGSVRAQAADLASIHAAVYRRASRHPRVQAAIVTLEAATTKGLILREDELARNVQIDPTYLSQLIRRDTGLTFEQLRRAIRLRDAVRDLLETTEQVAQIAYRREYQDPSHFDRDFRRLFRLTPTEFRHAADVARRDHW